MKRNERVGSVRRRVPRCPRVSVIIAAHNAENHIVRAIESVLNQGFEDLELLAVDCASRDRTRSLCERFAERDIRVEALCIEDESCIAGRRAALTSARGEYVLFLDQNDWFSPGYLDCVVSAMASHGALLAIPEISIDAEQADGARVSTTISHETCFWDQPEAFRRGASALIESGVLAFIAGKLFVRERLQELERPSLEGDVDQSVMVSYVRDLARAVAVEGARYHLTVAPAPARPAYDPTQFARSAHEFEVLEQLYDDWGLLDDDEAMRPIYRRHLRDVTRCIVNAALGTGRISSAERRQRVQDMVDAPATRRCVQSLEACSHEFGIMYSPIARRSAMACCMGARIQDIVDRALMPLGAAASARGI